MTIISPEREISLRPNDQVTVEFAARDDFGVMRAELVAFVGEQPDMKNALVLPPQPKREPKDNPKNASGATGTPTETKQADAKDGKRHFTSKIRPSKTADAAKSRQCGRTARDSSSAISRTNKRPRDRWQTAAENAQKRPPQTVVMPIPLGAQTGRKERPRQNQTRFAAVSTQAGSTVAVYGPRLRFTQRPSNGQSYGDASKPAESTASGQDPTKAGERCGRPASRPSSAGGCGAEISRPKRVAKAGKSRSSAALKKTKMADSSDRKQAVAEPILPGHRPIAGF